MEQRGVSRKGDFSLFFQFLSLCNSINTTFYTSRSFWRCLLFFFRSSLLHLYKPFRFSFLFRFVFVSFWWSRDWSELLVLPVIITSPSARNIWGHPRKKFYERVTTFHSFLNYNFLKVTPSRLKWISCFFFFSSYEHANTWRDKNVLILSERCIIMFH